MPLVAVVVGVLTLVVIAVVHWSATEGSIRHLSAGERAEVYARSIEDLERSCTSGAAATGALRDHCRQQAEFVELFPECAASCQALARSILPQARR
jgi:hypothetical protein